MSNRAAEHFNLLHRYVLILQLLAERTEVTSAEIREYLAASGHNVGIRTVQRTVNDMLAIGVMDWRHSFETDKRRPVYRLSELSPVRAAA